MRHGVRAIPTELFENSGGSTLIATGDLTDRIVPEVPIFIKANCEWAHPGLVVQATTPRSTLPPDPVYQTARFSFAPEPWMLLFVVLPAAFLLLSRMNRAWHLVEMLAERIRSVTLPGICTLGFDGRQKQSTRPGRMSGESRKQGKKRGSKPRSTRGRDKVSASKQETLSFMETNGQEA